jgi:CheY-like chemotaxis protein
LRAHVNGNASRRASRLRAVDVVHVDDDRDTRALVRHILLDEGARVDCFADAERALDRVRRRSPDVLVVDLALGGKDGFWLVRQVRALPGRGGLVPAVALSGLAAEATLDECFAAGFQLYIGKPAEPEALVRAVAALAGWRSC